MAKIEKEINERNSIIADFDIEGSILEARRNLQAVLGSFKDEAPVANL